MNFFPKNKLQKAPSELKKKLQKHRGLATTQQIMPTDDDVWISVPQGPALAKQHQESQFVSTKK